jgi:hypothetical protein
MALGDIVIIGGGCYGSFYLGQLRTARARGAVGYRKVLVVDRDAGCAAGSDREDGAWELVTADWGAFLDRWLDAEARDRDDLVDMIVPSPMMPHLMAEWLERRARQRWPDRRVSLVPADASLGTPYDRLGRDGVRYVSYADWLCPVHCVEPLLCPMIKAPRTWEMAEAVTAWTAARSAERPVAGPALFSCRHVTYGVGMYPAHRAFEAFAALACVADTPAGGDLVVGSISSCHGAVALLRVGPVPGAVEVAR